MAACNAAVSSPSKLMAGTSEHRHGSGPTDGEEIGVRIGEPSRVGRRGGLSSISPTLVARRTSPTSADASFTRENEVYRCCWLLLGSTEQKA